MLQEVRLGEPERIVRVVCEPRVVINGYMQKNIALRTRPSDDLITPERGRVVQVLHERVVPPQTHALDYAPLLPLFILVVRIILEDIRCVVREWMPTCRRFCSTLHAR